MEKVILSEKFKLFQDHWNPRIIGELNGQQVKLAKLKGEFIWHSHENEDELFYVVAGQLKMELRDRTILINPGEFLIVPRGVEHSPVAENEVQLMLFEPTATINTGNMESDLTKKDLQKI